MSESQDRIVESTGSSPLNHLRQNYGKAGLILGVGTASGLANIDHGFEAVLSAGLKQSAYSTISAVLLLKIYNYLEKRVETIPGELVPIIVPMLITVLANFGLHNLRGTEEPVLSTLPTAILIGIALPIWHVRRRISQMKDIAAFEPDFSE